MKKAELKSFFQRVASDLHKQPLPYIIPCVCGVVSSTLDSDHRDLSDAKQQQVLTSVEGQSHVGLYMHKPGSCTATCV